MRKPKTAWEVGCMALDQGISVKGVCMLGLIARSPYIASNEIQKNTGWSRNTVNTQLRLLTKNQMIGCRIYKGVNLYKLSDDRFAPFFKYLGVAARRLSTCQITHFRILAEIEKDHHILVYEIAHHLNLAESTIKNALGDIFKGHILAQRCRKEGYKFLPLLTVLTSVAK